MVLAAAAGGPGTAARASRISRSPQGQDLDLVQPGHLHLVALVMTAPAELCRAHITMLSAVMITGIPTPCTAFRVRVDLPVLLIDNHVLR